VRDTLVALVAGAFCVLAVACGATATTTTAPATPEPEATSTPAATATPVPPTPTPEPTHLPDPLTLDGISDGFAALQRKLEYEVAAHQLNVGGDIAFAVTDLQTGETIHVNGHDEERIPGCTLNFFVLLSVVMDLERGDYEEWEVGSFIQRTVYYSDPGTAHWLLRVTGRGDGRWGLLKVNSILQDDLGLKSALYDHPPAGGNVLSFHPDEWIENRISPLDFNRALAHLYNGDILSPPWTQYLIDKMSNVTPGLNHLIPHGVDDPNAIVAHKNGYIDYVPYYVDNDVGIVIFNRNGQQYAYALTFWSQDNPWIMSDVPIGQLISREVWHYFNAKYS
jgi:hypothetical protein